MDFEAVKVALELLRAVKAIKAQKVKRQKEIEERKNVTLNLLRGGGCGKCRYLIPKKSSMMAPSSPSWLGEEEYKGQYHCSLRTSTSAEPTSRSEIKSLSYSCKHYWKRD